MSELHTRIRDYLDKKNARKVETVTSSVKVKSEAESAYLEIKQSLQTPIKVAKVSALVTGIVLVMWALAVIDIQNDCWMSKECREWLKN